MNSDPVTMTGLVGYGSSDEDDSVDEGRQMQLKSQVRVLQYVTLYSVDRFVADRIDLESTTARITKTRIAKITEYAGLLSMSLLPLTLAGDTKEDLTVALVEDEPNEDYLGPRLQAMTPESSVLSAPASPHASYHATVRSLTLPAIPNLDIPRSPLGSPTPAADPRFSHFLGLKKQGIHFNTKLASSSALKNPSLLPRLMVSAGVSSEQQYTTTLPTELWDPLVFPTWAYKEELAEVQHIFLKKKEEESVRFQRDSINFIAAGTPEKSNGLVVPRGAKVSAAERLMAGLDKHGKSSPPLKAAGVRKEVESMGRTGDGLQAGGRSKSPRRRKRSHSR